MLRKALCSNRIAISDVKSEYVYTERENKEKSQMEVHTMNEKIANQIAEMKKQTISNGNNHSDS